MSRSRKDGPGGHRRFWRCNCPRCDNNLRKIAKYGRNKRATKMRAIDEMWKEVRR